MTVTILAFLVAARWIHFASLVVLFGSALFWLYAGTEFTGPKLLPRSFTATLCLLRIAAPLALLSDFAWLAGMIVNMTSDSATLDWSSLENAETWRLFFFETNFGAVSILRLALLLSAIGVVAFPVRGRASVTTLAALGAGLLVSQAWLGHAAEGGAGLGAAMIAAYGVHTLAAGAWLGGLPPLLFALAEQRHTAKDPAAKDLALLYRFSAIGLAAVALLIVSGVANAGFRVGGSFRRLIDTAYGETLFIKLALVALMLVLAFINRFIAMRRLRDGSTENGAPPRALRRNVAIELALGLLVLGVAAALGITPPPQ